MYKLYNDLLYNIKIKLINNLIYNQSPDYMEQYNKFYIIPFIINIFPIFKYNLLLKQNYKIIKYIFKKVVTKTEKNHYIEKTIRISSVNGYYKAIKLILKDENADPSLIDNFAIQFASEKGHYKIVKLLLKNKRVDPSINNQPIKYASKFGHYKIVKLLLKDNRVDIYCESNYPFSWACLNGHYKIAKYLLKKFPGLDLYILKNSLMLSTIVFSKHYKIIKLLINRKKFKTNKNINKIIESGINFHIETNKNGENDKIIKILKNFKK